jgi:septal ring factor EnvC (AmiA/AmiB activator)
VRSAILLRAALPNIRQSSADLQGELKDLYRLRAEIVERKEQAALGAAALVQKHQRLDALAKEKTSKYETLLARGDDAAQRMARMAREAEDLRALFAKLAEEKAKRDAAEKKLAAERAQQEKEQREKEQKLAAEAKAKADAEAKAQGRIVLKPPPGMEALPEKQTAVRKSDEEAVTRSFAKARGTMPFPVTGRLASKYGEASQAAGEAGLMAKGITIQSRAAAQVVAPFDGIVAFAGPFRGYGLLLIIEHSEGYHTLLAGMGHIDAAVGQRVLAGEPVGVMENDGAPALYVELRRDGQPINPLPWLADRAGKNSG